MIETMMLVSEKSMRAALFFAAALILVSGCATFSGSTRSPDSQKDFRGGLEAYQAGEHDRAERLFRRALKNNPRLPRAHFYLANLYAMRGEEELAIEGFRRAVGLEPNFPEAYYNLGTLFMKRGACPAAIQALEKAVELSPEDAGAFVNLGRCYFILKMPELAGAAFEEALMIDPDNEKALRNLELLAEAARTELDAEPPKIKIEIEGEHP